MAGPAPGNSPPWRGEPDGVALRVLVTPRAARARIGDIEADGGGGARLRLYVTEAPDAGKANAAVIKLLAKAWRLPKSAFSVKTGAGARRKTLFVAGAAADIEKRIRGRLNGGDP